MMKKDLTNSQLDRQNILNNNMALEEIRNTSNIQGVWFEDKVYFTKNMVAEFFEVDIRTIERCVSANLPELEKNGYEIIKGTRLKGFIEAASSFNAAGIDIGIISNKTTLLAIFDFKAFLNIAMLLVESENARILRQAMLNIVIDLVNKKTGGATKYINQRDKDFLHSYLQEDDYRREFTDALRDFVDMNQFKYAIFTDMIYQSIFKENAKEELEDHAFWILGRLRELGADCSSIDNPSLIDNLAKHKYIIPSETNNILTCIDQVAQAERGAIETYTELIEFTNGKDDITCKKMKEILKDEEKHLKEMQEFTKKINEYYNKDVEKR